MKLQRTPVCATAALVGVCTALACESGTSGGQTDIDASTTRDGSAPFDDEAFCRSASSLDIFDDAGNVDKVRYRALAKAFATAEAVNYRFGAPASNYHATPESFPTAYLPEDHEFPHGNGKPTSTWQIGGPWQDVPGGYNTSAGQVLYVPDDASAPGVDAIQFIEVGAKVVSEKPQLCWTGYGQGSPDQSTIDDKVVAAHGGPLVGAVAMARAQTTDTWTQDAIIAFQDGTLLSSGTHASGGNSNVLLALPDGLMPTAIALTTNNELALVTVWDTDNVRGGLAVIALGGPEKPGFWNDWSTIYPGLHSFGLFGFMKLLGVIWLDGMVAPIAIAASADIRWPMIGAPAPGTIDLADESTRKRFLPGGDLAVRHAAAGFAVVMSRSEKKVAFVDLQPVFALFEKHYFGTRADFDRTTTIGQAPDQWPYTFEVASEARPVVTSLRTMDGCPSAVATTMHVFAPHNFPDPDDDRRVRPDPAFKAHALVATEDGTVHIFDVGGLHDDTQARADAIAEVTSIVVGKNPTWITTLDRSAQAFGDPVDYAIVSRGDRRVALLHGAADASTLIPWKTLRDNRLKDPITVEDVTYFANEVPLIEVADYAGRQLVAYRYRKTHLYFFDDAETPIGAGSDGSTDFECGGAYPTSGGALFASSTNVP